MDIQYRIDLLTDVLNYRRVHKPSLLTAGEAIAIHQERAGWFMVLEAKYQGRTIPNPRAKVNARIELKIKDTQDWLHLKNQNI